MKLIFTLLLSLTSFLSYCQNCYNQTFETTDTALRKLIEIDTVNYHRNNWQIGHPNKTVFTSGFSSNNAIVTDTSHPYSSNDTSVFIIKFPKRCSYGYFIELNFMHRLDIDSPSHAKIEVLKSDTSNIWMNLTDTPYLYHQWTHLTNSQKIDTPNLYKSTVGWKSVTIVYPYNFFSNSDSLSFRFTFISGSNFNKEGWAIDNIYGDYFSTGVSEIQNNELVAIYPNPSDGNIQLKTGQHNGIAEVYNMQGILVYKKETIGKDTRLQLPLPNGIYILKYSSGEQYAIKQIIISR